MAVTVAHLTTCHPRDDIRVFHKECCSLTALGYDVHLIVADGKGNAVTNGVQIHDVGKVSGRAGRMLLLPWRIRRAARTISPRICHMHEPELLMVALGLTRSGARVIYDSHEDVPRAVLSRDWIPAPTRRLVSAFYERFEDFVTARIAAVVGATPHITRRFSRMNARSVTLNNFPLTREVQALQPGNPAGRTVCFIGNINVTRGIYEMIKAVEVADAHLILAGAFESDDILARARSLAGWSRVDYRGLVSRKEAQAIMTQSRVGLLLYHPEPNHVDAQPNKMFEYMSAGLPVLASDFPLWRQCVSEIGAGACVDPLDATAAGLTLKTLLDDDKGSREMGRRGRDAVLTRFQWKFEEPKLAALYQDLIGSKEILEARLG